MKRHLVLGVIGLTACFPALPQASTPPTNTPAMSAHYGKGTPALAPMTDLQGKPFKVEPLKGHWTLLYFWADWCVPCIEHGIPDLSAFVHSGIADASRYRIVAIRFNSTSEAGDWNDFKKKTERLEKTLWQEAPPFPLVYDSSTKVTTSWGIHELPSYALIDPKGNLVQGENLEMLKTKLARSHR